MRQTKIYTTDRRIWYVAESLEDIGDMYSVAPDFYIVLTQTNQSGSSQQDLVFLIKTIAVLERL